jgi:hypothetical protein
MPSFVVRVDSFDRSPSVKELLMITPGELKTNPLLTKIAPQPNDQRQFVILVGYVLIDESSQAENKIARVYPVLDLRTYLEIRINDLVYHEQTIPGQETSPTKLVMKPSAKVKRVTTTVRPVEAEFLSGSIAARYLPTAASGASANITIDQDTYTPYCKGPPVHGHPSTAVWQSGVCVGIVY